MQGTGAFEPGALVEGKYRIQCKLGSGSMGCVFKAVDIVLNRPVALKIISAEETASFGAGDLAKEAAAMAALAQRYLGPASNALPNTVSNS